MAPKVGIIGAGGIARHLKKRLTKKGWIVAWIGGRSLGDLRLLEKVDLVFNAISTLDNGEAARDNILFFVKRGIPVVTCEKGALAYHAKVLRRYMRLIGYQAACGGGSELLRYLLRLGVADRRGTHFWTVLNASLNMLFSEIGKGTKPGVAHRLAQKRRFLEPGKGSLFFAVSGELQDVLRKACVLFNTVLAKKEYLTPDMLTSWSLSQKELRFLCRHAKDYRYVVAFMNYKSGFGRQRHHGGFEAKVGEWSIKAGFRLIPPASRWIPDGPTNAVGIAGVDKNKRPFKVFSGKGAGHRPTTTAMITDAERLLGLRR